MGVERELSHYLWSLNNALSGLITLCNDKPEISQRIIGAVDIKLNEWTAHKTKHAKPCPIDKDDIKQQQQIKEENDDDIAWGDCSDDEDATQLFPEPTGLCKPMPLSTSDSKDDEKEPIEEVIDTVLNGPLFIDDTLIDNANKNEPIKPQNISTHDQLTWAQRTKQKQTMHKREHDLFDLSSNHSKDSLTHSNGVKASSKIKTKI